MNRSIIQISPEIGYLARLDFMNPLFWPVVVGLPEEAAKLEVLNDGDAFAAFQQFLGQHHVWTEAAKFRRTLRLARLKQMQLGLLAVAGTQRQPAQNEMAMVNGTAILVGEVPGLLG